MPEAHQSKSRENLHENNHSNLPDGATSSPQPASDTILHLQQTIGNQAVMRMVRQGTIGPAKPKSASLNPHAPMVSGQTGQKHRIQRISLTLTDWSQADHARNNTSGDGTNPIVYMGFGGQEIVLKFTPSDGAQQEFASKVYSGLVDAPKTQVIQIASPEGQQVIAKLRELQANGKTKDFTDNTIDVVSKMRVMVAMEKKNLSTLEHFTKELSPGNTQATGAAKVETLIEKMWSGDFFEQLGKIHAADMFLGNADRLDPGMQKSQVQNIFIDIMSGNALGMDLDVQASNLASVKAQPKHANGKTTISANSYKDWVQLAIDGSSAKRDLWDAKAGKTQQQAFGANLNNKAMDTANLSHVLDDAALDKIIDDLKARLVSNFQHRDVVNNPAAKLRSEMLTGRTDRRALGKARAAEVADIRWATAKVRFKAGVAEALAQMERRMDNGLYGQYFQEATAEHGADDAFDYKVLQIRQKYLKTKRDYPHLTEARIRDGLEQYAKALDTGQNLDVDPFSQAPARPAPARPAPARPAQKWEGT
jgi:hypothetical protein